MGWWVGRWVGGWVGGWAARFSSKRKLALHGQATDGGVGDGLGTIVFECSFIARAFFSFFLNFLAYFFLPLSHKVRSDLIT